MFSLRVILSVPFPLQKNNLIKNHGGASHKERGHSRAQMQEAATPSTGNGKRGLHRSLVCRIFRSQASHTVMDSNKSTALFEIPHLTAQHGGLWECRVHTNGGKDSRKFNLIVKGLKDLK